MAADGRLLCLRRWPESRQDSERLLLIHGVLNAVHDGGLNIVPVPLRTGAGESFVSHKECFWELAPWMPGVADYHANPSRPKLRSAMHALARFHLLAVQSPPAPGVAEGRAVVHRGIAPALLVRNSILSNFDQRLAQSATHLRPGENSELDARAARLLSLLPCPASRIKQPLAEVAGLSLHLQPAIRDIWHDHVLYTGDEVSGIVDFGALNIDTPLTDIARLVGSLVADDRESRAFACDAYSELQPLTSEDRLLIDLLDESGLIVAALNWLTWLYVDRRDMGPVDPIIKRLNEIISRLEHRA